VADTNKAAFAIQTDCTLIVGVVVSCDSEIAALVLAQARSRTKNKTSLTRCQPEYFRSGRLKNAKPIMLRRDFACVDLALIADPPSIWAGAAITILSTKSKRHPSNASYFPKVKFGTIALLILHHIVESTTVG
jgi:hypothetical protein